MMIKMKTPRKLIENKSSDGVFADGCGIFSAEEEKRVVINQPISAGKNKKDTASTCNFQALNEFMKPSIVPVVITTQEEKRKDSKAADQYLKKEAKKYDEEVGHNDDHNKMKPPRMMIKNKSSNDVFGYGWGMFLEKEEKRVVNSQPISAEENKKHIASTCSVKEYDKALKPSGAVITTQEENHKDSKATDCDQYLEELEKKYYEEVGPIDYNTLDIDILAYICGMCSEEEEKLAVISRQISAEKSKKDTASTYNFKAHNTGLKPSVLVITTQEEKHKISKAADGDQYLEEEAKKCDGEVLVINNNSEILPTTRKRSILENHDDDDDWQPMKSMKQKKAKTIPSVVQRKKLLMKFVLQQGPATDHPDLPLQFRQRINELRGTKITLVIRKTLSETDLSKGHDRLSMPFNQILNDFLTDGEKERLRAQESIEVTVIDPKLKEVKLTLRQWDMTKESGKTCSSYVLRKKWKKLADDNHLKEKQKLHVWSFLVEQSTHFALVVLK